MIRYVRVGSIRLRWFARARVRIYALGVWFGGNFGWEQGAIRTNGR